MLTYAHRGDHRDHPENTMAAFDAACAARLHGIETDLRHTRDGVVVLYHDHAVAGVPVHDLTHGELIRLSGIAVPTLDDIASRTWPLAWNLELKTERAYALSRDRIAEWQGDLLVTSFIHDLAVQAARETGRRCGALIAHRPAWGSTPLPHHGVDTLVWDWKIADPTAMREAHDIGWTNAAYGTTGAAEHAAARAAGVALLITDQPGLVLPQN